MSRKDELFCELDRLQEHLPDWATWIICKARAPGAIWVRIPVAVLLILCGTIGKIIPGFGLWMLVPAFALLAVDVPFLRRPMAKCLAFINGKLADA